MKECACGVLVLSDWVDCGAPRCVARTNALAADIDHRTWRFKCLLQVTDLNREASYELDKRAQEMSIIMGRRVQSDLMHEALQAKYRSMRREDLLDHFGD